METIKLVKDKGKTSIDGRDDSLSDNRVGDTHNSMDKEESYINSTSLETNGNENLVKDEYYCNTCDYTCHRKYNFQLHLNSKKHKNNDNKNGDMEESDPKIYYCSICKKDFLNKSGLWKHKKRCQLLGSKRELRNEFREPDEKKPEITIDLVLDLIKQNKELQNLLVQQHSSSMEQNNKIIELSKTQSITNNNNTTNHTTNQQFNLQVFLNETCKDAMNITDFINSLQLTTEDFENTGKVGFIEGISQIIIERMNSVDTPKRPIHCTDAKRETVYIKNDNVWEKEDDKKSKLRSVVNRVANKNLQQIVKWKEEHPDCANLDTPDNINFRKYYKAALGGITNEEDDKIFEKIKRNVLKEIVVNKSM
jgi:hypothetical protein